MTIYKSDKCINEVLEELDIVKLSAAKRARLQKILRTYFCDIHKEACEATVMAINKKTLKLPNFYD